MMLRWEQKHVHVPILGALSSALRMRDVVCARGVGRWRSVYRFDRIDVSIAGVVVKFEMWRKSAWL